jgi:hypothetical protein
MTVTITIDMDKKCVECGKGGAVPSGICMKCTTKAISGKPMKSAIGRAVQKRFMDQRRGSAAHGGDSK